VIVSERVAEAVFSALGRHLGMPGEVIQSRANEGLEVLGFDRQSLMQVLLDIERELGMAGLEVDDDALATPASLVLGVVAVAG